MLKLGDKDIETAIIHMVVNLKKNINIMYTQCCGAKSQQRSEIYKKELNDSSRMEKYCT